MNKLIRALQIFAKYQQETEWPTNCEHDILMIMGVDKDDIPEKEKKELEDLGFDWHEGTQCWGSYKYGSA